MSLSLSVVQPLGAGSGLKNSEDLVEGVTPILSIDARWEGNPISHIDLSMLDARVRALTCGPANLVLKDPSQKTLWSRIFHNLKSRRDLLHVALTCKFFYLSSIKILYERLAFVNPGHFVQCSALLSCRQISNVPKHLTIGFSPFPHHLVPLEVATLGGGVTTIQYSLHCDKIFGIQRSNSPPPFASDSLYSASISTFLQFSRLESLAFINVYVPPTSLTILSAFPNLRSLILHCCYYPDSGDDPIPELNELRSLTLRDLIFHDRPNFEGLLVSPKLSEVSIDDTSSDVIVVGKRLSKNLRRLRVFHTRNPYAERIHPDDVREVILWVIRISPLIDCVLTELGICCVRSPPAPPLFDVGCRSLTTLVLFEYNTDITHVKSVVTALPNLSSLSLAVNEGFIYRLSVMSPLPSLKKLNLVYSSVIPPDALEQHLGIIARGLIDLGALTSLGYFPTDTSALIPNQRVLDLGPLFRSGLLEVRLHHEYVWRRARISSTVWEQKGVAIYDETYALCLRTNSIRDDEPRPVASFPEY